MSKDPMFTASFKCWEAGLSCTAKMWKAVRNGNLHDKRGRPCADCGRTSTINEHRDYNKWWETDPTCRSCNVKRGRAAPFKHLPFNRAAQTPRFTTGHEQFVGQFAASMFHVNDEECADLSGLVPGAPNTFQAAE